MFSYEAYNLLASISRALLNYLSMLMVSYGLWSKYRLDTEADGSTVFINLRALS